MADLAQKYGLGGGRNPFYEDEDEDVDDFTFINSPKQGSSGYMLGSTGDAAARREGESRQQQLVEEMRRIDERTMASSERALGMVYESERIGIDTAEELLRQREQLQNAERNADDINRTLRTTQKHINSIKSVFGGLKNYFSKTSDTPKRDPSHSVAAPPSALENVVDHVKAEQPPPPVHPGMRIRGLDSPDYDDVDDDTFLRQSGASQQTTASSRYRDVDNRFNENLDQLSSGLVRLKGLAIGLGDEITDQNDMVDRIMDKVDDADMGVGRQTKQIKKILG